MASPDHAATVRERRKGVNPHRCLGMDGTWVACPPDFCEADALVADLERERALHVQMADKWQAEAGRLGAVEDELLARIATLEQERNGERAAKMIVQEDVRRLKRELEEALQANEGKANLALHDALIARADRYESHLKEIRAAARFKHYRSIELMADAALAGENAS